MQVKIGSYYPIITGSLYLEILLTSTYSLCSCSVFCKKSSDLYDEKTANESAGIWSKHMEYMVK